MSEAQIEATREMFAAVGRRDLSTLLDHMDREVELHPLTSVWEQTYGGHAGIEKWFREVGDLWREFSVDAERFQDLGDGTLLMRMHWRGRAKPGAAEVESPAAVLIRVRGELAGSVDVHLDEARALASVAL